MRKYTSTKHILIAALVSSALVACGNDTQQKSSAQNVGEKPAPATGETLPELKLLDLPYKDPATDGPRLSQVGLAALKATLMADAGNSAVAQTVTSFSKLELPKANAATGWLSTLTGPCSPAGNYVLNLSQDEGPTPTDQHSEMDTRFSADFNDCTLKNGTVETRIDGKLGIDLSLGLATIIGSPSFHIETKVTFSDLVLSTNNQAPFFADGLASYRFATENGYVFTTTLTTESLQINSGLSMNLVNFTSTQANDTRDSSYSLTAAGKYVDTSTGNYVEINVIRPFTGVGYGYPLAGRLDVTARGSKVAVDIQKGSVEAYPPNGYYVRVGLPDGSIKRFTWGEFNDALLSITSALQ